MAQKGTQDQSHFISLHSPASLGFQEYPCTDCSLLHVGSLAAFRPRHVGSELYVKLVVHRPDMVGQVVGGDSQGGWTQPGPTPSNLSFHSLLQQRRERERAWHMLFFFHTLLLNASSKMTNLQGPLQFLSFHIHPHCICN